METKTTIKKLGLAGSFAIYIPASLVMLGSTQYLIPYWSKTTGQETLLFCFLWPGWESFCH